MVWGTGVSGESGLSKPAGGYLSTVFGRAAPRRAALEAASKAAQSLASRRAWAAACALNRPCLVPP